MDKKPLRPYQKELVKKASELYKSGALGVLMQSATGSGKTRTAAYIVDKYTSTGRQVLWIVHREELLMQASMVFAEAGIEHVLVCSSSSEVAIKIQQTREHNRTFIRKTGLLVIASVQTLVRRLGVIPWLDPKQIIADECHLSLAETWQKVIRHWPEARLLGLSATPTRLDGKSFARKDGGLYDEIICGPRIKYLIEQGNLAKYKIYAPPLKLNEVTIHKKGKDFDTKDLESELDAPVIYGDVVEHYARLSKGKPAIAFCPTISSAQKFAEAFNRAGFVAVCLDGSTDDSIRRESLAKLGRGEIDVVTSVSILVEGTDVPFASTAILLRRTESLVIYLQAIGRVLRPHPDKDFALILDFVGVAKIHGLPCEDREWSLSGEIKQSRGESILDADLVKILTCPNCHSVDTPKPVCSECGHVFATKKRRNMKEVDGQLIEITSEMQAQMIEKKSKRMEVGRAQTLAELLLIERNRGYKKGWALHVFKSRNRFAA